MIGIYQIQSISNPNRIYIGSAINLKRREKEHFWKLKNNKHHSIKLQRHYNKYGKDDLVFSIVTICEKEELRPIFCQKLNCTIIRPEQFFIWAYNPYFNACKFAGSPLGHKHTLKTKKEMSKRNKGENHPMFGRHHTKKSKKKMGQSHLGNKYCLGRKLSKESILKMSLAHKGQVSNMKGKHHSEETKKKISDSRKGKIPWNKGIPHTEETKRKIGNANSGNKSWLGRKHTEETKNKMRIRMKGNKINLGHKHSEETKQKMRKPHKTYGKKILF